MDTAMKAVYDFGLFTHPNVVHVQIKDLENPNKVLNLIDRRELQEV